MVDLVAVDYHPFPPPEGFVPERAGAETPARAPATAMPPPPEGFELEQQPQYAPFGAPAPPHPSSLGGQLLTGFENTLAAGGQLTTPNIAAHAPNYLGPATVTEEGSYGFKDASGTFVPTDRNKHVVLVDPADQIPKVYARSAATDEGRLSALGHIVGSGIGAGTLPVGGVLPAMTAAESIGVNVPRAISSRVPGINLLGQAVMKAPGGGPLSRAVGEAVEATGAAIPAAVEKAGGPATAAEAGGAFRAGTVSKFGQEVPDAVTRLYDEVDTLVDPRIRTALSNTRGAVDDIMARRANYGAEGMPKAVSEVINSVRGPPLDYTGIKNLRSAIGELLSKTPEGMSQTQLKQIYAALSDDLRASVQTGGGQAGVDAFERANTAARGAAAWEERVGKVLGTDARSDEGISATIQRMASTGAGADVQTLSAARAAVPREAWNKIASNTISALGRDRKGDFSPAIFLNDYARLSDAGKNLLFGSAGSGELLQHLDAIRDVSQQFVRAGKLANVSGTASHALVYGALGVMGHAIMEGDIVTPLAILGAGIGNNLLARWLSVPAMAGSVARWNRAMGSIVSRPGARSLATLDAATRQLSSNAVRTGAWQGSADDLNDRIKSAAVQ